MSNRLSRLKDSSDIVFKKAPRSINVFIVIKNSAKSSVSEEINYVTKNEVEIALMRGYQKVVVLDVDASTVLAMNFLDNV